MVVANNNAPLQVFRPEEVRFLLSARRSRSNFVAWLPIHPAGGPRLPLSIASCAGDPGGSVDRTALPSQAPLFTQVPAAHSGVDFANTITESPEVNYFTYIYAYNGGGVALGDLDGDEPTST